MVNSLIFNLHVHRDWPFVVTQRDLAGAWCGLSFCFYQIG